MKLYIKPGACSLASHIVLREIGAEFEIETVDTAAGRTASGADYRAINPMGYVPALDLGGGEVATENAALLQYLAETAPEGTLAAVGDPKTRMRQQELLSFLSSELHKAYSPLFRATDPSEAERREVLTGIDRKIARLERILSDGRAYLTGDRFGVADAYAFVILNWSNFVGHDMSRFPHCTAFVARVADRPAVRAAMQAEGLVAA